MCLKYFRGHLRSLGYYEVTSGLIQNAPIELKMIQICHQKAKVKVACVPVFY